MIYTDVVVLYTDRLGHGSTKTFTYAEVDVRERVLMVQSRGSLFLVPIDRVIEVHATNHSGT